MRYLRELVFPHPAMKTILEEYLQGIDAAHARVERIEGSMLLLLESWRLKPAVKALMAFRGFQLVAAMITVSELGDIHRFEHPRQLMTYLGLVPTEASSGPRQRQGSISAVVMDINAGFGQCAEHRLASRGQQRNSLRARRPTKRFATELESSEPETLRPGRLLARRLQPTRSLWRELCGFIWALPALWVLPSRRPAKQK